jgi:flagellar motor switch protein FliN/FliY
LAETLDKLDGTGWLTEEWTGKLEGSIELMTETRPGLRLGSRVPAGAPGAAPPALWISIPLDLPEHAAVFIGAAEESWLQLGKAALAAAGVSETTAEDARSTYLEIITQATSGLAQAIAARIGKPVACLPATEVKLSGDDLSEATETTPVEISLRESPLGTLYMGWNSGMDLALAPPKPRSGEPDHHRAGGREAKRPAPENSRTFDLLMEVELPVSVSFGRAHLPLRDVLKLNSGSIVELNRTISDPVEIIVNNCVIARGEVVVVEGNYGVRIQHVISREERLRTLK